MSSDSIRFFLRAFVLLICCWACLMSDSITHAQDLEPPKTPSIATIKSEIIRTRETVKKLFVDFTIKYEPDELLTNSQILQQLGKGGYQKFAFDGIKRYNSSFTQFFSKNLADESLLMTFDGEKLYSRTQKRVKVSSKKSGSVDMCNYLNISLWPISNQDFDQLQHEAPEMVPFLPQMLDSKWTVDDSLVAIGQYECLRLVENSGDRELFLSPKMNFALVRYSFADKKTGLGFGEMVCDFSNFQLYGEIYFPGRIESEIEIFEGSNQKLAGLLRTRLEVRELNINEFVPNGLFEFSPAPGDMVFDFDTGEIQQVSDEGDDNRLQLSLMEAKSSVSQRRRSDDLVEQMWKWMLAAFFFGATLFLANRILANRWHRKEKKTLLVVFCLCFLNCTSIGPCFSQESNQLGDEKIAFEKIVWFSHRYFFDLDLDGTLVPLMTSYRTFETPTPLIELLLQEDVSNELELVDFQIMELREVQKQLIDAQKYTLDLIGKYSILTEIDKVRCLEKLASAIKNGNQVVEKILISFQKNEFGKILLILQIRRIGLYSALTTDLLHGTIDCTDSQKAKMDAIFESRNEEISKKLRNMRADAVEQILSLLTPNQRQVWESKFGNFEQFDSGLHGVFIEQLGSRWIELAKMIKVDDETGEYPALALITFDNKYIVGIDGFPRFDFGSPGRPPDTYQTDERLLRLLNHVRLRPLLDLSTEQGEEIEQLNSLQSEYQQNKQADLNSLVEKHGWDQEAFRKFRHDRIEIRRQHSGQMLDRIDQLLLPFQMNLVERMAAHHGFQRVGVTYLLLHSDFGKTLHLTDSQTEAIQKKSDELFIKLRKDSADLEQKINQELIAILTADQKATLKSITGDSIRMEAGQFDTQFLLRQFPQIAREIAADQALILRFLGKEPAQPEQPKLPGQ